MGMQTADDIYDYMVEISEEVDNRIGSGYSTEEEKEEYYRAIYDVLCEKEQDSPRLSEAEDSELVRAIEELEDENFHGEVVALIAYMHNTYNWPVYSVEDGIEYYPYLYED